MSYPKNPDTIVLKNRYYSSGLKEIDVYNYYMDIKRTFVQELKNRQVMLIIFTELNNPVIKKKEQGKPIKLTSGNFDEIITGRTVSIHNTFSPNENFGIIDIDADDWKDAKKATLDVYDEIYKAPFLTSLSIRYTGKSSFHIICNFGRRIRAETIRYLLSDWITKTNLLRKYSMRKSRKSGIPNIDLYRNVRGANFIALNALSIRGLKCMEIQPNRLKSFDPRQAVIKTS